MLLIGFFLQAEDGIRDIGVTGVQTCALPIFIQAVRSRKTEGLRADIVEGHLSSALCHLGNISYRLGTLQPFRKPVKAFDRSEERRVGKEGRSRWSPYH